jgi:hypothetical protein
LLSIAAGCASIAGVEPWTEAAAGGGGTGDPAAASSGTAGGAGGVGGAAGCELAPLSGKWAHSYGSDIDDEDPVLALGGRPADPIAVLFAPMGGDANLGGGVMSAQDSPDLAAGVYDAAGQHLGSEMFNSVGKATVGGVAFSHDQHFVLAGSFVEEANFTGFAPATGANQMYVAKLSSAEPYDAAWVYGFGDASVQAAHDVAVSGDGDIYVVGASESEINFYTHVVVAGLFLVRLGSSGATAEWATSVGTLPQTAGDQLSVVSDAEGRAVVAGRTATEDDGFIARFAASGQSSERFSFDGGGIQTITAVAVDEAGNIAFSGWFTGASALQGEPDALDGDSTGDAIVGVLDPQLNLKWHEVLSDDADLDRPQRALGVAFRGCHVVVVGEASGRIRLGDDMKLVDGEEPDAFWAELDADTGAFVAGELAGDELMQGARAVAARAGEVWIAGVHEGVIDFGEASSEQALSSNVFLAKLAP